MIIKTFNYKKKMVFLIINLLTNIDFHTNHNKKYISE